jgi:hypothetical protein
MDLSEFGWEGGVEWIQLSQDTDRWWAVVNAVMNLRVLAPRSLFDMATRAPYFRVRAQTQTRPPAFASSPSKYEDITAHAQQETP